MNVARGKSGCAVFAQRARQTRMLNGKVGYYADFGIYGTLVVAYGCVCVAGEPLGSVDVARCGDRGWQQLDTRRIPSASLRAASNAADRRSPPRPPCGTTFLCQHADVGKSVDSGRTVFCPDLAPVFAQCRARSNQRARHRLALVRDCASCHPLSPAAATRIRSQASVASTSSSSFSLRVWEFRCDDRGMGLPVWYPHLIRGAGGECRCTTTRLDNHSLT